MIWIYRLLFLPVMLVAAPWYLLRMRRRGGYRQGFLQRFGVVPSLPPKSPGKRRVWLQAVSVGEMLAIGPVLEAWRSDPAVEVYLTTTTSTGHKLARERYGAAGLVMAVGYFPLDWWLFSRRAWRTVRPDLAVVTEGERWPEHLQQARARGVPAVAINARLSDRSFGRMRRAAARPFAGLMLRGLTRVLAASEGDAERFRALGVPADRVSVTGNIKLDLAVPRLAPAEAAALRVELGFADAGDASGAKEIPVIVGASTWPGEEAVLLRVFSSLRAEGVPCRLLLVPRHAERRAEIESLLAAASVATGGGGGMRYSVRSRGAATEPCDVTLADTTGELRRLVQMATVVFVGKSLPPHGEGQTPVEAAALGKPVLFGPGMANFRQITRELLACGSARRVSDAAELEQAVRELLADPGARARMGAAGEAWHQANQGAVTRTLRLIFAE
ncbi:3-deoxy-D-manno-octulosonic acid transferase [Opitutaceae bacterium TAV4]|nr:3-deoxy-D-manno-octulosonic acid transferase [Opitutaceae bacterium TAV4]RRK01859.1 3-deoxy-D-manno-octulosonic acid transferase [Opitutaceae bacterium TAV3]